MFQSGVLPWSRRRGSSCLTSDRDGGPAWTSLLIINYFLTTIKNQTRLARSLPGHIGGHGVTLPIRTQDLMQHSSPLLLPSRPNSNSQQHDDESNQNNAQEKRYVGRKRRRKAETLQDKVADATRLLKAQIAKANIIASQSHGPSAFSRQQSPAESTSSGSRGDRGGGGHPPSSPLSPTIRYDVTSNYNETDSNSYATTTSLFTSSESSHHEPRLPSPSIEVMDISSPPTTGGVTEFSSSPSTTALTDYSSPLGVGYSSPPLEAMGYYSPPPLGPEISSPPMDMDMDTYASPPPVMDPSSQYPPPVHPYPSPQHHFGMNEAIVNKIDWGSDSEDEQDEDRPPPTPTTMDRTDSASVVPSTSVVLENTAGEKGRSPGLLPESSIYVETEAQQNEDDEEDSVVPPRTISECEVDRLHLEKIENLNGNYDSSGSFREWNENLRVQTYGGEELLILPYTVIDF